MHTSIINDVAVAAQHILDGQVVAIPTETVYGLAGNALSEDAINKIYEIKERPKHNPLIAHINNLSMLEQLCAQVPKLAYDLATAFWPGPLTILLPRKQIIPGVLTAGSELVAVRMPQHAITLKLIELCKVPLAAPSANPFNYISPSTAQHVYNMLSGKIKYILDGGPCQHGVESTIVSLTDDNSIIVHRFGSITLDQLKQHSTQLKFNTKSKNAPVAPGMLLKHYSPNTKLIATDDIEKALATIQNKNIAVLAFNKSATFLPKQYPVQYLSSDGNLQEAAKNLYSCLHELDALGVDIIVAELAPQTGLGIAINDKLVRASG